MKKVDFEELLLSVREMKEIMAGRQKPGRVWTSEELLGTRIPDVAELRARHNLSQAKFAAVLRVSIAKVRDWEHKRRVPAGHELVRLQMLDQHPVLALRSRAHGKKTLKAVPVFKTAGEEREFWSTADTTDYFDWSKAKRVSFPNLKRSKSRLG